ncbi:MAG: bacteriohemerythrin [Defluviitaleaceae bacterium]|nr:bacteriohemerythrin [Defluviitaleaceae bacterium]
MITFNNSLITGIKEVDEQHMELVERINHLFTFVDGKVTAQELEDTFTFLVQYVAVHFETEDRIMQEINYPDMDKHIEQHELLINKAVNLREQLDTHGYELHSIIELRGFLLKWIVDHIKGSDLAFAEHYHKVKG